MINGSITLTGQATLPVSILSQGNGQFVTFNFLVDTGFTGGLQLPVADVRRLALPLVDQVDSELADGRIVKANVHAATISWLGNQTTVNLISTEGNIPLIGTNLLWGSVTHIEWEFGGRVSVEPIPRPEPEDE